MADTASRVLEMDAVRGAAMLGVIIAHSATFIAPHQYEYFSAALTTVGMFATPTFLLLSGVLCGYGRDAGLRDRKQHRLALLGRGLFLVTIGHLLLGLTHWTWEPLSHALWHSVYITDAVGVSLAIASQLPQRCSRNVLLATGAALLLVSWLVTLTLSPTHAAQRYVLRILFGLTAIRSDVPGWIVPIVPYLGIFLIGMAGGVEYASRVSRGMPLHDVSRFCMNVGIAFVSLGIAAKLAWLGARPHVPVNARPLLQFLAEPNYKIPPGPTYVFAFGGGAVLLTGIVAMRLRLFRLLTRVLATIGQASFVTFVLQYWLISVPTLALGMHGGLLYWAAGITMSTAVLFVVATYANRIRFNRVLTLKGLLESRHAA